MKLNSQQLKNISVTTESGEHLGILESFNLETESQSVLEYVVKPDSKIKELISGNLIVPRGQVVDITAKKIIVNDLFLQDKEKFPNKISEKIKQKISSPAVMSKNVK